MSISDQSIPANAEVAALLDRIGLLLQTQGSAAFRVQAYHRAAETLRHRQEPIAELADDLDALEALPTIGKSIAHTIAQFVKTGHARILDRLQGQVAPEDQFMRIPGIGEQLASQIHHELNVETLEELEIAAHDGRLEGISGIGKRRVLAIQNALQAMLSRREIPGAEPDHDIAADPSVATLLEIDALYRAKARAGELRLITPRRFNPEQKAWLPIMHVDQEGWHFTILFSNTKRAHDLEKTHDWVILVYERDGEHGQSTVVTETHGILQGERVVRGREEECTRLLRGTPGQNVRESQQTAGRKNHTPML